MKTRNYLFCLLFATILAAVVSGPVLFAFGDIVADEPGETASREPAGPLPIIEVEETTHDFGFVAAGECLTHVFRVRNTGKADLMIEKVKGG